MDIGNAIKQLRKEKGLSQIELAKRCKITQTSLSQIETGVTMPNKSTLKKISTHFGVPELIIHLLALEEKDVAKNKKEAYDYLFPTVKQLIFKIVE